MCSPLLRVFILETNCSQSSKFQDCEDSSSSCSTSSKSSRCTELISCSQSSGASTLQSWSRILTRKRGFKSTEQQLIQPPSDWLNDIQDKANRCRKSRSSRRSSFRKNKFSNLSPPELRLLYAHYQIWRYCLDHDCSVVILDSSSYSTQSSTFTAKLIRAAQDMDADLVYFGKYLDQPNLYQPEKTIYVSDSDSDSVNRFSVYSTSGPYGSFAQYITPQAAGDLIREMYSWPETPENLAHYLIQKKCLKAWVYHPSIVKLSCPESEIFTYECREPVCKAETWTWGHVIWYGLVFILLVIVVLVAFTLVTTNLKCAPDQKANCGYYSKFAQSRRSNPRTFT